MQVVPLELRKWFAVTVAASSITAAAVCLSVVRSALPSEAQGAQVALLLLFIGGMSGFFTILNLLLPLALTKLFPALETPPVQK